MPIRRLLVGVGYLEDGFFGERLADNLHAYGQSIGKAGGDGDSRQAGDVYGQGAHIAQVHLEWVVHLFPDFEGDGG